MPALTSRGPLRSALGISVPTTYPIRRCDINHVSVCSVAVDRGLGRAVRPIGICLLNSINWLTPTIESAVIVGLIEFARFADSRCNSSRSFDFGKVLASPRCRWVRARADARHRCRGPVHAWTTTETYGVIAMTGRFRINRKKCETGRPKGPGPGVSPPCTGLASRDVDRQDRGRAARTRADRSGFGPRSATVQHCRAGHPHRDSHRVPHKLGGRPTLIRDGGSESR